VSVSSFDEVRVCLFLHLMKCTCVCSFYLIEGSGRFHESVRGREQGSRVSMDGWMDEK